MNLDRAMKIAKIIRNHREHWDQVLWFDGPLIMPASALLARTCGTTGCIAGWAAALAHPDWVFADNDRIAPRDAAEAFSAGGMGVPQFRSESASVEFAGADWLELNPHQHYWLFDYIRTEDEVLWALENDDPDWVPK